MKEKLELIQAECERQQELRQREDSHVNSQSSVREDKRKVRLIQRSKTAVRMFQNIKTHQQSYLQRSDNSKED